MTGTLIGLLLASVELITTVSVRVPGVDWPVGLSVSTGFAAPVPAAADSESHGLFRALTAVQLMVPPSPFAMWIVSVRATTDPTFAESATESGVTTSTGCCNRRITRTRLVVPASGETMRIVSR